MSWFEFQDIEQQYADSFDLQPEKGLIFTNIKVEEEFKIVNIELEEKKDGGTDPTEHVPG